MAKENIKVVEAYLKSLEERDLSKAPFADDIHFDDPVAGSGNGADDFRGFLSGFLPAIGAITVRTHICENDIVVTQFDVETVFGTIHILEKFVIKNGMITETMAFYDPRPIVGG